MTHRTAWVSARFAPALLAVLASCSTTAPSADDGADGPTGGAISSGGTTGSGGAEQSSGGNQATGGSLSGSGGRGGLMANQCTDAYACGAGSSCYAPGTPPPAICGAPDWCGDCSCPAMIPVPTGDGQSCGESTPCPDATDLAPNVAGVCNEESGLCTQCLSNDDCDSGAGFCEVDVNSGVTLCFQCRTDADCPETGPFCFKHSGSEFGMCRPCRTTADCETGVCSIDGLCLSACQNDEQCGPNRVCGSEQRCVPQPCQADTECSEQSTCSDQTCRAKTCTQGAACPGGYCVDGSCYETPGGCQYDTAG